MHPRLYWSALVALVRKLLMLVATLLLAACGDPAPGEGMKKPPMSDPQPEIVSARKAVNTPDIPTIDPQTLDTAEIAKVLRGGPLCVFAHTAESPPVVALEATKENGALGVVKIHGRLVKLTVRRTESGAFALSADGMAVEIKPASNDDGARSAELHEADMHFELEQGLRVGYRGWYRCTDAGA
jgi:hypothetical protein